MFGYGAEFNKKIMSTNHFQDFFESSGLGRFGAIHPNVIEKVTSL